MIWIFETITYVKIHHYLKSILLLTLNLTNKNIVRLLMIDKIKKKL